jgi:hypothetical protein
MSEADEVPAATFAVFLESYAPGSRARIADVLTDTLVVSAPELQLHCESERCGGERVFHCREGATPRVTSAVTTRFLWYMCRNCGKSPKVFALFIIRADDGPHTVVKLGELPTFGPPLPSRVISMVGPDRELFLKGRRAENQGLGIAAFAYYRRVVEAQWGRIVDAILRVAEQTGSPAPTLEALRRAKEETQFRRAVELVRESIPDSLRIDGHNPLTLLFGALSDGLHDRSDEHCLQLAGDIRAVLSEFAERVGNALNDKRELSESLARLASRTTKPAPAKRRPA